MRDVQVPTADAPPTPEAIEATDAEAFKICPRCLRILPETAFNCSGASRQGWCRECFREYFKERGQLHVEQTQAAKRKRVIAARAIIENRLSQDVCTDCGIGERLVLEFDHVGTKRDHITKLSWGGTSEKILRDELANCEVVCVNCHRRRTALRGDYWRVHLEFDRTQGRFDQGRARNRQFVYEVLSASNCFDWGIDDLLILEFDHLDKKEADISALVSQGCALERLREEIAKCSIRCANCHRRQTLLRSKNAPGEDRTRDDAG